MTPGRGKLAQESGCPHNRAGQVTSVYRPNMLEPHEWASPLSVSPELEVWMTAHGSEDVFSCGWGNLRRGGAFPPGADCYGLVRHHRRLVDTDVGELGRSYCCWWPLSSRVET